MMGTQAIMSPEMPSSPLGEDYGGRPLGLTTFTSHLNTRGTPNASYIYTLNLLPVVMCSHNNFLHSPKMREIGYLSI